MTKKLTDKVLFTLNNVEYFGEVTVTDESTVKVTNAVKSSDTLKDTAKNWLKADNLDELLNIEVSGLNTLSKVSMNASDKLLLESIDAQAKHLTKYALAGLQNKAIDSIS